MHGLSRRAILCGAIGAISLSRGLRGSASSPSSRARAALDLRTRAANAQSLRELASLATNGDEDAIPGRAACFVKGLARTQSGGVAPPAYQALLDALQSRDASDFDRLPRGGGRRLANPQAAFAFHLEGGDPHTFAMPAPPSIRSRAAASEVGELYWQALCRDVPFAEYGSSPLAQRAAKDLGQSASTLFRGASAANARGPYLSQFLLKPIRYGGLVIEQRYEAPVPGTDFLTSTSEWSQIQAGLPSWRQASYDTTLRFIRNGRDLAEYVHFDHPYQPYLNAALILINSGPQTILNCNQFKSSNNPYRNSTIEDGFVTFGQAEVTDWLGRVTTAALKATWFQKWCVHRRLRPEEFGGLVHQARVGGAAWPIHEVLLKSAAVEEVFAHTGACLLPQAYPEGSPLHPSYPSGHAAIAGACSIVLKACFDGSMLLPGCVEPSADGLSLRPCEDYSPTVGDEIDKLAFNVSMGRNWAGIHYRSDAEVGIRLGEDVAISILQDLAGTYTETFKGFSFRRFDGTSVHITPRGEVAAS
jgi:hypothetical protein